MEIIVNGSPLQLESADEDDVYCSGDWRVAHNPDHKDEQTKWKATKTVHVEGGKIMVTRYGADPQECVDSVQEFIVDMEVP